MHGPCRATGERDRARTVVLRAAVRLRRSGVSEVAADVAGVELDRVQTGVHVEPGRIDAGRRGVRVGRAVRCRHHCRAQNAGRSGHEGERVLVGVHRSGAAAEL